MPDINRLSTRVSPEAAQAVTRCIQDIRAQLPMLLSLTNEERRSLPKLGDGRLGFDEDCAPLMREHSDLVPPYLPLAEVESDRALRSDLDSLRLALLALVHDIESTQMVAGSEVYNASRAFYANAQQAATRGVLSAQMVVDTLAKHFSRPSRPAVAPQAPAL